MGDPQTGRWTTAGSLPRPREYFALVSLRDGSAFAVGGETDFQANGLVQSYRSTYRFDPNALVWQRSGDLAVARTAPLVSELSDGRILVAGGFYVDGVPYEPGRAIRAAEIFDPRTGTSSMTGMLAVARGTRTSPVYFDGEGALALTLADGRVLVVGGLVVNERNEPITTSELFDPTSGTWNLAEDLPGGFMPRAAVALEDGDALVTGQRGGDYWGRVPEAELGFTLRFDAGTGTWTEAARMLGHFRDRVLVTLADGRVLAAGGEAAAPLGEPAFVADAELYEPTADRWLATVPMPQPRRSGAAVRLPDGSVLLVAGETGAIPLGAPGCADQLASAIRYVPG